MANIDPFADEYYLYQNLASSAFFSFRSNQFLLTFSIHRTEIHLASGNPISPATIPLKIKRIGYDFGMEANQALCLPRKFNCVHVQSVCLPTKKRTTNYLLHWKEFDKIVCWCGVFIVRLEEEETFSSLVCMNLTVNHDNYWTNNKSINQLKWVVNFAANYHLLDIVLSLKHQQLFHFLPWHSLFNATGSSCMNTDQWKARAELRAAIRMKPSQMYCWFVPFFQRNPSMTHIIILFIHFEENVIKPPQM